MGNDNSIITGQQNILKMPKDFYEKIYSEDKSTLDKLDQNCPFTTKDGLTTLTDIQSSIIDRPLTNEEFLASLKDLKRDKTPGCDGLTVEFYGAFWKCVGDLVTESLIYSTVIGLMDTEQRQAIITLIPKKDRNRLILGKEIKISQFADDTTCFLKTTHALEHMLDCIERFRRYAGLKNNKYKRQYMAMESYHEALLPNIQWSNHLTILGIVISKDSTEYQNYLWNFKPHIDKIRNICLDWRNRNISLKGKVTIINSLIFPTVLYPATVIYTPQRVYTEVNKIITWFLWKSYHNRIAKATMCSPIDWGGLAVPDLESKVVVSNLNWIKRIFMDTNCLPSIFLELLLNKGVNIKDFISTKMELNVAQSDDLFYNKVLHDWHDIYNHSLETEAEFRNEILWHNKFITIGGKPIYLKAWVKAGIMRVQDILEGERFMSEVQISQKYKISCNFMEALQIRMGIPGSWRRVVNDSNAPSGEECLYITNRIPIAVNMLEVRTRELYWIVRCGNTWNFNSRKRWLELYPELGMMNET